MIIYDVWRCLHSTESDYTFYSNTHGSYLKLDLFPADKRTLQAVASAQIGIITWSDHVTILFKLFLKSNYKTTPVWHLNASNFTKEAHREKN